jgi:hypothetical protein
MVKCVVLWTSRRKATIVSVTDGVEEIVHVKPPARRHVKETPGHRLGAYYREVIDSIGDAQSIFVFGSARAKMELKSEILKIGTLSHRVVGTETADAMTDTQLLARARDICGLRDE